MIIPNQPLVIQHHYTMEHHRLPEIIHRYPDISGRPLSRVGFTGYLAGYLQHLVASKGPLNDHCISRRLIVRHFSYVATLNGPLPCNTM